MKIYLVSFGPIYKIGCSKNPISRIKSLARKYYFYPEIILIVRGGFIDETKIHNKLKKFRIYGREWYSFSKSRLDKTKYLIKNLR